VSKWGTIPLTHTSLIMPKQNELNAVMPVLATPDAA